MPRKNFENIGVLQGYEYIRGVITDDPDYNLDTCTVSVKDAEGNDVECADTPIFYHCSNDAEEREDNGAIEGGAAGFVKDDEVIVLKQRQGAPGHAGEPAGEPKIFVIGHVAGIKACGMYLRINSINGYTNGEENAVNFNSVRLLLIQPIETNITSYSAKGEYVEDYVILADVNTDSKGVAKIELDEGKTINPDYPLYVLITEFIDYYTDEWRGAVPDYVVYRDDEMKHELWYYIANGGLQAALDECGYTSINDFSFLLDGVRGVQNTDINGTAVDLNTLSKDSFETETGVMVSGWNIDFVDLKQIHQSYLRTFVDNIPCVSVADVEADAYYKDTVIDPLFEIINVDSFTYYRDDGQGLWVVCDGEQRVSDPEWGDRGIIYVRQSFTNTSVFSWPDAAIISDRFGLSPTFTSGGENAYTHEAFLYYYEIMYDFSSGGWTPVGVGGISGDDATIAITQTLDCEMINATDDLLV